MRLIDADALPVCKEHCIDECGFGANFYVVYKTDIDAAPTIHIEAEPVTNACFERSNPRCPNCPMKWSTFCDIDGWLKRPAEDGG